MSQSALPMCPCGSGLRSARCCAPAQPTTPVPSHHLIALGEQAQSAHRQGDATTAERLCLELLELAPDHAGAVSVLYQLRRTQGNASAAEALIRRLTKLQPNNVAATHEYAVLLLAKGAIQDAEIQARNAVRLAPQHPQSHNLMGMILTEGNRPQAGEYHYRRVLELSTVRNPIVLANLAWNLKSQGRMQEGRELYQESAAAAPAIRQTLLGWARLEEADRRFDAANALLDQAARQWPDDPGVLLSRAVLLGRMKRHDEALMVLDLLTEHAHDGHLQPNELAEKGRLLDQLGRYDEAFAAFQQGKRILREHTGHQYQDAAAQTMIGRLTNFFTADRLRTLPVASVRDDVPQPVFVLGFPRSGTTLMEQTLSAHPRIVAGDELPLINDLTNLMPRMLNSPLGYPEALAELWMGDQRQGLDNLRDHYLQKVAQMGFLTPEAGWFTDKMPLNETHLGLIALLFPQAPLIHVIRHPLDIMVSVMSNHFTHGFFCASTLETAARHYISVMNLVRRYCSQMTLRYLPVRYEAMVTDHEATVRSVLAFIGAPFDPKCLQFHDNQRHARTASYAQVSEPLYDRSRFRYRHYRKHLEPVIPMLQPYIEQLGYTID